MKKIISIAVGLLLVSQIVFAENATYTKREDLPTMEEFTRLKPLSSCKACAEAMYYEILEKEVANKTLPPKRNDALMEAYHLEEALCEKHNYYRSAADMFKGGAILGLSVGVFNMIVLSVASFVPFVFAGISMFGSFYSGIAAEEYGAKKAGDYLRQAGFI